MSGLRSVADSARVQTALAVGLMSIVAGPFVLGRGVDVPDDFLYAVLPTWESVRWAVLHGENPFFMPGRMGGAALFTEANEMGPLYPSMWLSWLMPVRFALPLAYVLHLVGAVLSGRWLARTLCASAAAATAAGLVYACGPFGLTLFIEAPADFWPIFAGFPAVLAAHRRMEFAEETRERLRWAVVAGVILAAMLTGGHIRHAGATCGALGLWFLLRWRTLPWAVLVSVLGVAGGANAIAPALLEYLASRGEQAQVAAMAIPPTQTLGWSFAASWIAPKPFVTAREFGLGAVLGVAFAFAFARRGGPERDHPPTGATLGAKDPTASLGTYVALLLLTAAGLPGARVLLSPLTVLAHPVLIIYYALAMAPAAALGALGLDRLVHLRQGGSLGALRGLPGALLGLMLLAVVVRFTPLGWVTFGSSYEWGQWVAVVVQATLVIALAVLALRRLAEPERRMGALLLLLVVDLAALGVRTHVAIPSQPLQLAARADVPEQQLLAAGSLHAGELAALLEDGLEPAPSLADTFGDPELGFDDVAQGGEVEDLLAEAPLVQERLLDRRWPLHLASRHGWRSLSGRTKLAPPRSASMLLPLARTLTGVPPFETAGGEPGDPWDETAVRRRADRAFAPGGLGERTLALHGVPVAVDETGGVWRVQGLMPRCYSPGSVEVVAETEKRVRALLSAAPSPARPALIEGPLDAREGGGAQDGLTVASVACGDDPFEVTVQAAGPAVVVMNERLHPGWEVHDERGPLETFAVNQVHTGVLVEAGTHQLRWRFVPPGLRGGLMASFLALMAAFGLLLATRQRPRTVAASAR
ncbi:MAG: hypothetical protein KDA24_13860 [Deltaproteobacteria bacterium]|nr:hypothetical protein [Deltaproteobacteria bacterium]